MIDMLCDTPDKRTMIRAGGGHAVAYGPDGASLAEKMAETEEGLLLVEIDLGRIALAKAAADPVGHYARPDVLRLWFDRQPRRCVEHPDQDDTSGTRYVRLRDDLSRSETVNNEDDAV